MTGRWTPWAAALFLLIPACGGSGAPSAIAKTDAGRDASPAPPPPRDGGAADAAHPDAPSEAGGSTFSPTTTLAALVQNNTSACGSSATPCSTAWTSSHSVTYASGTFAGTTRAVDGFWDNAVAPGAADAASVYGKVSKVPIGTLLPGYSVPIWVETQNWWGDGNGHIDNGEASGSASQIQDQVNDHVSRGIAGQVVDWYGPGTTADRSLPHVMASAEATGGKYGFAIMVDKGYFSSCGETVACLNAGIGTIVKEYAGSSAYLKDAAGHPLVFFFINKYYPTEYALLSGSGVDPQGTRFVMYEPNGFPGSDPPNTAGEYAWVGPADASPYSTTMGSKGTFQSDPDFGFNDLSGFFASAASNPSSFIVSAAYKGFDDNLANWSGNRIIDQRCGATWLETFRHQGNFGGRTTYQGNLDYLESGKKLDMVLIDTWDDYEEGTEIETGIDNCLTSLTVTFSLGELRWAPTWGQDPMDDTVSGSEETLARYSIYVAKHGGTSVMHLADVPCSAGACGHTLDLGRFGLASGTWDFYVQAVGQPSVVNTLGGPEAVAFAGR